MVTAWAIVYLYPWLEKEASMKGNCSYPSGSL